MIAVISHGGASVERMGATARMNRMPLSAVHTTEAAAMSIHRQRRPVLAFADADIDLVPMIDCVFLLLLFFMLCGRITLDTHLEQVSVPPATTGQKDLGQQAGWTHLVLNVLADRAGHASGRLILGTVFDSGAAEPHEALVRLRSALDAISDRADTYEADGLRLPKVMIEIRADGDVDYRRIQELELVLADRWDPGTGLAKPRGQMSQPFTVLAFTTRSPGL
jgi:biopolymer transport protein ExbD